MHRACVSFLLFLYAPGRESLALDYNCSYSGIYWLSDFVVKLNFTEILGILACSSGSQDSKTWYILCLKLAYAMQPCLPYPHKFLDCHYIFFWAPKRTKPKSLNTPFSSQRSMAFKLKLNSIPNMIPVFPNSWKPKSKLF